MHGCRENKAEGKELLLRSLHAFPCNWTAWLALATLQGSADLDADSSLPRHWMRNFFLAYVCVEGQENEEALGRLQVCRRSANALGQKHATGHALTYPGYSCVMIWHSFWTYLETALMEHCVATLSPHVCINCQENGEALGEHSARLT